MRESVYNQSIMIELINLTKIYHSENEGSLALKGITLKLPETGFVAITGESGSGKTTLLNVLSGFASYEEGDLFIDGVDFSSLGEDDLEAYRKHDIGFVFQDYHLIESHTVLDNLIEALLIIGVPYQTAKKKSLETLEKFGLLDHKKNKARELSSGQKQKLAIARALIKEPKIILCDEPTANLDGDSGIIIFNFLKEYAKDHLVIVTTHNYEDAKDYVTHFVRLYKGNLTSYEKINEVSDVAPTVEHNTKSNFSRLSAISLKNQKATNIVKAIFSSLLVVLSLLMLAMFTSNIDDSFTRVISRSVFNNVSQNEMLVMKKNGEYLAHNDMASLKENDYITGVQLYGLATEMNYYYRENIDYGYDMNIAQVEIDIGGGNTKTEESIEYVFKTLHDDLYIKSATGMIDESYLKEGNLPVDCYEVVASSNYKVGDFITVFFHDQVIQGFNYFQFDFKVVGILNEEVDDIYFSDSFIKGIDYIQYYSNTLPLALMINYLTVEKWSKKEVPTTMFYDLTPLYNPYLGPKEIQFSAKFLDMAREGFPALEKTTSTKVSFQNRKGEYVDVTYAEKLFDYLLPSYCVYVGKDIYDFYLENYESKIGRVLIDNYSHADDVIRSLTNQKYDCLSEYRSASTGFDLDKQDQRAISLTVSLVSLMAAVIIFYVFGFFMEKSRLSVDHTLHLLGASNKSIYQSSIIQLSVTYFIGLLLGIGLYLITLLLPFEFLAATNLYLRFYHFFIVSGVVILLIVLLWIKYRRDFLSYNKKGGRA